MSAAASRRYCLPVYFVLHRLNRQYLINFNAIKEVEHYFARKLLVNAIIPARDKLIVSKEKVAGFLHWLAAILFHLACVSIF